MSLLWVCVCMTVYTVKHSQYFFKQLLLLHLHPVRWFFAFEELSSATRGLETYIHTYSYRDLETQTCAILESFRVPLCDTSDGSCPQNLLTNLMKVSIMNGYRLWEGKKTKVDARTTLAQSEQVHCLQYCCNRKQSQYIFRQRLFLHLQDTSAGLDCLSSVPILSKFTTTWKIERLQ